MLPLSIRSDCHHVFVFGGFDRESFFCGCGTGTEIRKTARTRDRC
jgi:hypothetical protein